MNRFVGYAALVFVLILFASSATSWHAHVPVPESTASAIVLSHNSDDFNSPSYQSNLITGRHTFKNACLICHGAYPGIITFDFSNQQNKHSPRDIFQIITWGHPTEKPEFIEYTGNPYVLRKDHPAFPVSLSESERWAVANYVYSGERETGLIFSDEDCLEQWQSDIQGEYQLNPAWEMYENLCSVCHGNLGYGNGPLASDLIPPPRSFRDTSWLASQSDDYLFNVVKEGKSELSGMPWWGDYLTDYEIEYLVRFLRAWGYSFDIEQNVKPEESVNIQPDSNDWTMDEVRRSIPGYSTSPLAAFTNE